MPQIARKPKIQPMAGWVLIYPMVEKERETDSGIILLKEYDPTTMNRGIVIALGKPLKGVPVQMKYMDNIIYPKSEGIPVDVDENGTKATYLLMKQHVIIGVI